MGTHPIFESDFDCLTDSILSRSLKMSVERKWTSEEIAADAVGKKEIIHWLNENAAEKFLFEHKLMGAVKNVAKKPKEVLIEVYEKLFEVGAFKGSEHDVELVKKLETLEVKEEVKAVVDDTIRYKMRTIKKGPRPVFPVKGDAVRCYYKGHIGSPQGKIFDQLQPKNRGSQTLNFKVGLGRVIRGWDEALLKMAVGETAGITIEPEWAYGKKGCPDAGIGPNQTLYFEVTLDRIG